jgi:acyl carrier protein
MEAETRRQIIQTMLLGFLREEVFDAQVTLDEHTDLLEAGFDSLALLRLLNYSEQHLGVRMPESQITGDRIRTVYNMAEWIDTLETEKQTGP